MSTYTIVVQYVEQGIGAFSYVEVLEAASEEDAIAKWRGTDDPWRQYLSVFAKIYPGVPAKGECNIFDMMVGEALAGALRRDAERDVGGQSLSLSHHVNYG